MLTNSYILIVSPAGSVSITAIESILTNFNSTISLTCMAEGGPDNMFVWRRQGMIVSDSSALELTMITGSDGGVYECIVTNDAGSDMNSTTVIGMCYSCKTTFSVKRCGQVSIIIPGSECYQQQEDIRIIKIWGFVYWTH